MLIRKFEDQHFALCADLSTGTVLLPGDKPTAVNGIRALALAGQLSGYTGGLNLFRLIDMGPKLFTGLYPIDPSYTVSNLSNGYPSILPRTAHFRSYQALFFLKRKHSG